jgi:hypothetical protein
LQCGWLCSSKWCARAVMRSCPLQSEQWLERELERIFDYRSQVLSRLFRGAGPGGAHPGTGGHVAGSRQ